MWQPTARWVLGWAAAQKLANDLLGWKLNRDEAYVDRIKREFNLRDYHQARALYESNRGYWEQLYGDDPLTSPNHPASPPKSLLPRQPGAGDYRYDMLNPAATSGNAFGQFGTGGQFAPGSATHSRPLYAMQSIGSTPPDATDDNKPVRRLSRVGDTPAPTVFDSGAPAVPFVSPNPIPLPDSPATFKERFPAALPPPSAPPGPASPDDLEAFRRHWLKAFMEP